MSQPIQTKTNTVSHAHLALATFALIGSGVVALAAIPLRSSAEAGTNTNVCDVAKIKLNVMCQKHAYQSVEVTCASGVIHDMGGEGVCKSVGSWQELAAGVCARDCSK